MPNPLEACGMKYCFLDEAQFTGAGASRQGDFYRPCLTEDQGKTITVFPIAGDLSRKLQEGKPFEVMENILASSASLPQDGPSIVTVFPRRIALAERENPDLGYHRFFEELSNGDARIEFTTPGKVYRTLKGLGRLYFPGSWDTGGPEGEICLQPRQFLNIYPETNFLYAKMLYVHLLINQLRGDRSRKRTAQEELWKAQDSEIFRPWKGLLHSAVRKAAYRSLLEAEKLAREKGPWPPSLSVSDINLDREDEYLFQDEKVNCYLSSRGAGIFELDYLKRSWNYLDAFSYREGSEDKVSPGGFFDFLLPIPPSLEVLDTLVLPSGGESPGKEGSEGKLDLRKVRFCGGEIFETAGVDRIKRRVEFHLPPGGSFPEVDLKKTYGMQKNILSLEYTFRNAGAIPQGKQLNLARGEEFAFVPSICLSFPGGDESCLGCVALRDGTKETLRPDREGKLSARGLKALLFKDIRNEILITLEGKVPFDVRIIPLIIDGEYQTTCILPFYVLSLPPGGEWETRFSLRYSPTQPVRLIRQ
jgi:hypothetical protein